MSHVKFLIFCLWACDGGKQGWNILQRESMQGEQLKPDEWKRRQQQCQQDWGEMSQERRDLLNAKASDEDHRRREACRQPFQPKEKRSGSDQQNHFAPAAFDAASTLSSKSAKAVSRHRTFASYKQFKKSTDWQHFQAGISNADGALTLDHVDLKQTEEEITDAWSKFARAKPSERYFPEDDDSSCSQPLHHTTCWASYGACKRCFNVSLVQKLVWSMGKHLESSLSECLVKLSLRLRKLPPPISVELTATCNSGHQSIFKSLVI